MDYRSTPATASRRWPRRSRRHLRVPALGSCVPRVARYPGAISPSPREARSWSGERRSSGYVDGEELDRPLDEEGWFHQRLGELDESGYLRVGGRLDNLFISGGENVQPEEIEEALCRLNGVDEAVVVPVPDEEFGARPVAFIRINDGEPGILPESSSLSCRGSNPISFHPWPEEATRHEGRQGGPG